MYVSVKIIEEKLITLKTDTDRIEQAVQKVDDKVEAIKKDMYKPAWDPKK